ncbi:hypothetical protein WJX82_003149 [Trebouxia sp. C0006]
MPDMVAKNAEAQESQAACLKLPFCEGWVEPDYPYTANSVVDIISKVQEAIRRICNSSETLRKQVSFHLITGGSMLLVCQVRQEWGWRSVDCFMIRGFKNLTRGSKDRILIQSGPQGQHTRSASTGMAKSSCIEMKSCHLAACWVSELQLVPSLDVIL